MLPTIAMRPHAKPAFVRPGLGAENRVMFHQVRFKASIATTRAISAAASRAKLKQAQWLRDAVAEKLSREVSGQ